MFGNGSPFGTTNSTFGTGGFGTTTNAGGGVFGQPAQQQPTTNLFGGGGTGFGGQTTNLPVFGAGATAVSTGAFGAQPNTTGLFGQPARPTTGLFNSTSNTTSPFSVLNSTTQAAGTSIRFNATIGTESGATSQSSIRFQTITCMKEYENKSLEELRLEDYQLNRKGTTNTLFGITPAGTPQAQPGGGLFSGIAGGAGTQPGASPFGQTSTFGQPAAAAGGNLFGSLNQPKPGGLFGSTATPTSTAFGATPNLGFSFSNAATQPQPSIFGQNNNNTATSTTGVGTSSPFSFNAPPQQQQQWSGFGQKPMTTPVSSAPTFAVGFGNAAAATNTAVNKPLFGAGTTVPTFGVASTANTFGTGTGSLFTTNTQQQKPFSFSTPFTPAAPKTASQPVFGGTSTPTFTFSNPVVTTPTPAINFGTGAQPTFGGATATTGVPSAFVAPTSVPVGGTLSQAPAGGTAGTGNPPTVGAGAGFSLFGSGGTNEPLGTCFGAGGGQSLLFQQQLQQQQQAAQTAMTIATTPFMDNPIFYNLIPNRKTGNLTKPSNPLPQRQSQETPVRKTNSYTGGATISSGFNLSMAPAVKNLTFANSTKKSSISKFKLFDGFEDDDHEIGVDILSTKSDVKKLDLKKLDKMFGSASIVSPDEGSTGMAVRASLLQERSPDLRGFAGGVEGSPRTFTGPTSGRSLNHNQSGNKDGCVTGSGLNGTGRTLNRGFESDDPDSCYVHGGPKSTTGGRSSSGVVCSRPQYFVKPSLEEMEKMMDANGNCVVQGLEIGRVNFGRIRFLVPVNVANVDIDAVVHFRHKEVLVCPDDTNKPELGLGLNVPSEIELKRVWPVDKSTNDLIRNPGEIQKINYEAMLRKACKRTGSEFVSYDMDSGIWKFRVPHF